MFNLFQLADGTAMFWGQTFTSYDLVVILLLVLLEGMLSIDNALVLGLLAKRVPKELQGRALSYGLIGAFVFRIIAICLASLLLRWSVAKLLGGGYLVYIAVMHLFFESKETANESVTISDTGEVELRTPSGEELTSEQEIVEIQERVPLPISESSVRAGWSFWKTVLVIELTDIAFAVDSILAALALVGSTPKNASTHDKLWVVVVGGILGLTLMRVAAAMFIKVLDRFPRFEISAYLLVIVIGIKLLADWGMNSQWSAAPPNESFSELLVRWILPAQRETAVIDFHSVRRPEFWVFWISMLVALGIGFLPARKSRTEST